jgi:ATPase family associated with various cellular activities (AAA)
MISQIPIQAEFEPGNYLLLTDSYGQHYMDRVDDFEIPNKIYGNVSSVVERYAFSFNDRNGSTGIFLCGIKGSGKTLTAQMLCKRLNLPVVIVNKPYHDNVFVQFLSELPGEFVVFFDEFEKVYSDTDHQNALLTLLDGNFKKKRLFLMTSNSEDINYFLRNRPGRIFYKKSFPGIESGAIAEYLEDRLVNKDHIDGAMQLLQVLENPSMDIMSCLVEEMNRFGEEARVAASYMNIELEGKSRYEGKIKATVNDVVYFVSDVVALHPYSSADQTFCIMPKSYCGMFVSDTEYRQKMKENDYKFVEEVYVNDIYVKVPAEAWVPGPDGSFAATVEAESAGEDDDVVATTFEVKMEIHKEKAWSYSF